MNNNELFRVYNTCKYDIGVKMQDGRQYNIRPGTFILLDANDIAMIENQCRQDKFFAKGMLVAKTDKDEPVDTMQEFRIMEEEGHNDEDTIKAKLSQPVKKIEAWLETVTDQAELYAIWDTAKTMDLPSSKLKLLNSKIPDRNWLE